MSGRDARVRNRADTDAILGQLLSKMETLENRAVQRWGGLRFRQAQAVYAEGDEAYLERDYALAATRYAEAIDLVFDEHGGRIGRGADNDWVLPDLGRRVSRYHADVRFDGKRFRIADTSTNGVYVNGDDRPLGRGRERALDDGDRIRLGRYEISVRIDEHDGTGRVGR